MHEAAALGDALIWGHLFTGDPTQCARVAGNLIAATADVATGWNRYFRAASLLARAHVEGDHESVCSEGERLLRQPLTDRTRDLLTAAMVFGLLDGGRDLDAVELSRSGLGPGLAEVPRGHGPRHSRVGPDRGAVARRQPSAGPGGRRPA